MGEMSNIISVGCCDCAQAGESADFGVKMGEDSLQGEEAGRGGGVGVGEMGAVKMG